MTPADERPRRDPHDDSTDSYVIDTRRRRGRVSSPRNPLGGAGRITGGRDEREDDRSEPTHEPYAGAEEARGGTAGAAYPSSPEDLDRSPSGTRRMPVQQPAPRRVEPPRPMPRPSGSTSMGGRLVRPARKVHHVRRAVALALLLLVAWLAFLVVTPLLAWSSVSTIDASPDGDRPAHVSGHNYLLVGSDSRAGMSTEEENRLSTGGAEGQRTDSIILVHVSDKGEKSALVSLPRDSYVPIPGHGKNKINAAFALGGPELLVETVEQATGVPVDGYLEIGFGGFANVVDSLGGVTVDVPFDMNDPKAGINLKKGTQTLDGPQALGFVRARYSDPEGDLGRAKRQRQFLGAIMHKAVSPATVLLPWRYWGFTHSAARGVRIGEGTGIGDITKVLQAMRASSSGDGLSLVVPISDPNYMTAAGDAVKWDREKAAAFFDAIKNDQPLG